MTESTRFFRTFILAALCTSLAAYRYQGDDNTTVSLDDVFQGLPNANCRMGYGVKNYYPTEDDYYHHQTCFWCYNFTPSHRRKYNLNIIQDRIRLSDGIVRLDIKFSVENETHYFDLQDEEGWAEVSASMLDVLEAAKLKMCCREAIKCCQKNLETQLQNKANPENVTSKGQCPATWDGWTCFPDTPAGETATFTCPQYAYKGQSECALEGRKTCWPNGTWAVNERGIENTDYASCSHLQYHLKNYYWEVAMHAISMVALTPAVIILSYYRALRAQRFKLHLNFFWALYFKALFNLLDIVVLRIPEYTQSNTLMDDNTGGCKFLVFLAKVFSIAVWTWMLTESLYLHRLIVTPFKEGGKTYVHVLIGWVPPIIICSCWAISRALLEDYQCWLGDDQGDSWHLYLITELPKLIILVINTILLAIMTYVLLTSLRGVNDEKTVNNRIAAKATIFLLPMFGLQFFITAIVPPYTTPCIGMHVYFFLATAVDGLQGFYVSIAYCYMNTEVKNQVARSMHMFTGSVYTSIGPNYATYDPKTEVSQIHSSVNHSGTS